MPESQVPPQETQQPETSLPQQEPPRQVGQPQRNPLTNDETAKQRAEQVKKRAQVEKKNPFSPVNRQARLQEAMDKLRSERGVAQPRQQEVASGSPEQERAPHGDSDVRSGTAEPDRKPADSSPHRGDVEKPVEGKRDEVPEWYKRQQDAAAAERKASEALANAERERATLEKAKADADAAVQRMAAAKEDPVGFLAETGMTSEEWSAFMANGGKLTPEQKQLKAMQQRIEELQSKSEAAEKKAQQRELEARAAMEESHFAPEMQKLTFVPEMGGMAAVRARQRLLSEKTGQPVSLANAAQNLEQEMQTGLSRLLQIPKIRSSLTLDVNSSNAGQAAEVPRTLNNRVSPSSSHQEAAPHPLDFTAKRRLWLQRVERDATAKTGR